MRMKIKVELIYICEAMNGITIANEFRKLSLVVYQIDEHTWAYMVSI